MTDDVIYLADRAGWAVGTGTGSPSRPAHPSGRPQPDLHTEYEAMLTEEHQADEWTRFGLTTHRLTCQFCRIEPSSVRRPDTDTVACGKCALKRWFDSGALAYIYANDYAERELRRRDPEWPG